MKEITIVGLNIIFLNIILTAPNITLSRNYNHGDMSLSKLLLNTYNKYL